MRFFILGAKVPFQLISRECLARITEGTLLAFSNFDGLVFAYFGSMLRLAPGLRCQPIPLIFATFFLTFVSGCSESASSNDHEAGDSTLTQCNTHQTDSGVFPRLGMKPARALSAAERARFDALVQNAVNSVADEFMDAGQVIYRFPEVRVTLDDVLFYLWATNSTSMPGAYVGNQEPMIAPITPPITAAEIAYGRELFKDAFADPALYALDNYPLPIAVHGRDKPPPGNRYDIRKMTANMFTEVAEADDLTVWLGIAYDAEIALSFLETPYFEPYALQFGDEGSVSYGPTERPAWHLHPGAKRIDPDDATKYDLVAVFQGMSADMVLRQNFQWSAQYQQPSAQYMSSDLGFAVVRDMLDTHIVVPTRVQGVLRGTLVQHKVPQFGTTLSWRTWIGRCDIVLDPNARIYTPEEYNG